jgi:hypothetical protein
MIKFREIHSVFYLLPALCCWRDEGCPFVLSIALWAWVLEISFG